MQSMSKEQSHPDGLALEGSAHIWNYKPCSLDSVSSAWFYSKHIKLGYLT